MKREKLKLKVKVPSNTSYWPNMRMAFFRQIPSYMILWLSINKYCATKYKLQK